MKSLILFVLFFNIKLFAGYSDTLDSYQRELLVFTNIVRTSPISFRDIYTNYDNILLSSNYPKVEPLYHNLDLVKAAVYHANDMAYNEGLNHSSSDGTSFSDRLHSFYSKSGWIAENIATGYASALNTVIQWVGDETSNNVPASDNSSNDGHRKNIMNSKYHEMGGGYAYNKNRQWYHFWCQDFGGGNVEYEKIPSACAIKTDNGDSLEFLCTYYDKDNNNPKSLSVIFNNEEYDMEFYLGSKTMGTYKKKILFLSDNYSYRFKLVTNNDEIIYYPETKSVLVGNVTSLLNNSRKKYPKMAILNNPASKNAVFRVFDINKKYEIKIYDLFGNSVFAKKIENCSIIKTKLLPKGVYKAFLFDTEIGKEVDNVDFTICR